MSAPAPWRHVRYDYERGLPLHRICHRYALFDGVGEVKILKLASHEGWCRPTPDPSADFGPLTMLDPKQPLPVVLLGRTQPSPAMQAPPGSTQPKAPPKAAPAPPKAATPNPKPKAQSEPVQAPVKAPPKSKLPPPTPLPERLPTEVQISDYSKSRNPITRSIGGRFRHFRLVARVSRDQILNFPGLDKRQREIEYFEQGEWFAFSRMAPFAKAYAAVLGVSPDLLCEIGGTHLNVDVQDLLFNTEYAND